MPGWKCARASFSARTEHSPACETWLETENSWPSSPVHRRSTRLLSTPSAWNLGVWAQNRRYLLWLEMGPHQRCKGGVSLSLAAFDYLLIVKKGKCRSWRIVIFFLARWFLSTGSYRTPSGVAFINNGLADEGCHKWTWLRLWPYPATDPCCGLWQVISHLCWPCPFAFW